MAKRKRQSEGTVDLTGNEMIEPAQKMPRKLLHIPFKEVAVEVLEKIMDGKETMYCLLKHAEYKKHKPLRSRNYEGYYVLCHANAAMSAGWLVCNFASTGSCAPKKAFKRF